MCSALSGSYGAQKSCPTSSSLAMSSGRDMQGKGGFSWVHCTKCPPESSLLVKKVPTVVRDLSCPLHMLSPRLPSDSNIFTRQLAGVCRGKSKAWIRAKPSDPCREQNYDLGLLSTISWQTRLTEPMKAHPSIQVCMQHWDTQRLPGCSRKESIQTTLDFLGLHRFLLP